MGLPTIDIIFKQLSGTAISRASKGKVALIVRDETEDNFDTVTYKLASDVDADLFTATNYQYIQDCFYGTPASVTVIRIDVAGAIADALTIVEI